MTFGDKHSSFQFSHDFSHIHLSQFESWLLGEDILFRYRRNKQKETGWIDSNVFPKLLNETYIFSFYKSKRKYGK
jgi:hypothetical protein